MKSGQNPYERIDAYLERLEKEERSKKQKRGFALGLILLVAGGVFLSYQQKTPAVKQEELSVFAEQLPPENIISASLTSELAVDPSAPEPEVESLPLLTVRVEGTRQVGEELVFDIENFQDDYQLTIDYGNGIRRKARSSNRYIYPLPGHFEMNLLLQEGDSVRSLQVLKYEVLPAPLQGDIAPTPSSTDDFSEIPITRSREPMERSARRTDPLGAESVRVASSPEPLMEPQILADVMPHFPGGQKALDMYLSRSVRYPAEVEAGRQGQVVVQFVVQADGSLSELVLLKGLGEGFDQEAIRVVTQMPLWVAGKIKGQRVPVYQKVIIPFRS